MVLLRALNYDFSGQVNSQTTLAASAGSNSLTVLNNVGIVANDYVLIEPYTDRAEICKVTSVSTNVLITLTTNMKFDHPINSRIFKTPYNQVKYYQCATVDGTYAFITNSTQDMDYRDVFTPYNYTTASIGLFYKRTFFNFQTSTESDIGLSDYWQSNDEFAIITPFEVRTMLQLGKNDFPTDADIATFIKISQAQFLLDCSTSNKTIQFLGVYMVTKFHILRGLAVKSVSRGYVTINAEGRQITKSYQELVLEAENTMNEYKEFLTSNFRKEATSTAPMFHSGIVATEMLQTYKDIMTGVENADLMQRDIRNMAGYNRLAK